MEPSRCAQNSLRDGGRNAVGVGLKSVCGRVWLEVRRARSYRVWGCADVCHMHSARRFKWCCARDGHVARNQFVCDCVFRRRRGCPCDLQEPEKAKKAFLQFTDFMLGTAPFDAATIAEAKDMPAHKWWALYGATVPELQRVAMIVLAAVSGAGEAERCWKAVDWIHCKRRNRLTAPRAKKLLRVYTSQQLAAKTLASAGEEQYWAWHKSDSEGGEDEEEQEEEEASPPP